MKTLSSPLTYIKESLNIFFERENFIYFLKIYIMLIPFQLFILYQNYFIQTQSKLLDTTATLSILSKYPAFMALIVLVNLAFVVVSLWVDLTAIKGSFEVLRGSRRNVKVIFSETWKKVWPFALLSILSGLIIGGGMILLIIPGIIFTVWYSFAKFVFVDKKTGIMDSLRKSKELVKGRFWSVLGRILVIGIFTILVSAILTVLPYNLGSVIGQLFGGLLILPSLLLYRDLEK